MAETATPPTQFDSWPLGTDITLQFSNDDATITSIAGWAISFYLYNEWGTKLFTLTVGNGVTITNPTSRLYQVVIGSARTVILSPQTVTFSVWRTDSGLKGELAKGSITLTPPPPQ